VKLRHLRHLRYSHSRYSHPPTISFAFTGAMREKDLSVGAWDKVKVIGRGGSSTVYKCVVRGTGGLLAVKEIMTDGMSADQIKVTN
jgi:hypothetical protein